MKHLLQLFLVLTVSFSFAQKKELKLAQKLYKSQKISEARASLDTNKALLEGAEAKISAQYYLLNAQVARAEKNYSLAFDQLGLAKEKKANADLVSQESQALTADLVNQAITLSETEAFLESSNLLYLAYKLDKKANVDYLYYAASNAVNSGTYDVALDYYKELKAIKYSGITTQYFVTDVKTNEEREVTETEFTFLSKSKDYTNARSQDTESKFPEIVKNIALIYTQLDKKEEAIAAVKEARAENPDDLGLILTEANLYIQLGEKDRFSQLMEQAIAQDPNNPTLYYNLGVVTEDAAQARSYYEKAIELDPNMQEAYLNLVALILEAEPALVEKMNSLGRSRADEMKYEELKKEREGLYKECVPILQKLVELDSGNQEAVKTLMNIYYTLDNMEGYAEMKKLLE